MRFTIPQFIEHEAKVVGPLTFKQVIFFTIPVAADFILYFSFAKTQPAIFWPMAIALVALGGVFAFLKIGGRDMTTFVGNLLKFSVTPKMYIWQRKGQNSQLFEKTEIKKDGAEQKTTRQSQMADLKTKVDTK